MYIKQKTFRFHARVNLQEAEPVIGINCPYLALQMLYNKLVQELCIQADSATYPLEVTLHFAVQFHCLGWTLDLLALQARHTVHWLHLDIYCLIVSLLYMPLIVQ